jgi:hypothetical protein
MADFCNFVFFRQNQSYKEKAISMENFIIAVYCLVDEMLKKLLGDQKLCQRGFKPDLSDSEMITMSP